MADDIFKVLDPRYHGVGPQGPFRQRFIPEFHDVVNSEDDMENEIKEGDGPADPVEKATIAMWQRQVEMALLMQIGMCFQHTTGYFKDRLNAFSFILLKSYNFSFFSLNILLNVYSIP